MTMPLNKTSKNSGFNLTDNPLWHDLVEPLGLLHEALDKYDIPIDDVFIVMPSRALYGPQGLEWVGQICGIELRCSEVLQDEWFKSEGAPAIRWGRPKQQRSAEQVDPTPVPCDQERVDEDVVNGQADFSTETAARMSEKPPTPEEMADALCLEFDERERFVQGVTTERDRLRKAVPEEQPVDKEPMDAEHDYTRGFMRGANACRALILEALGEDDE